MSERKSKLATIIGGSGFLGTQLVQQMADQGFRIRVGVRRPDLAGHVRPLGSVGQIQPIQVNIRDFDSVARAVKGADIVINLAGIWHESGRQSFDAVNTLGAANVARAAAKAGVPSLIHVSALGADPDAKSNFLRSKALGEKQVLAAFPKAVIFCPATMFGPGDRFFNLFGTFARLFPVMPVIGGKACHQPVYVVDVAGAITRAAQGMAKAGTVYELGGPDILTMKELMQKVVKQSRRRRPLVTWPMPIAQLEGWFLQWLPNPWLTVDQAIFYASDEIVSESAIAQKRTFEAFSIKPKALDALLPTYMWRFAKHGQFERIEATKA
ncbi:NAD-dependent epimerase/dehydratase [hydrothermal vent metagenome]|uniref:NAD-dependent epimerase/dehydratase n=1 Tax=hydrothermal vent metagenome TaxID=652676 RepID=A0A3B0TQ54_9ZZZZ